MININLSLFIIITAYAINNRHQQHFQTKETLFQQNANLEACPSSQMQKNHLTNGSYETVNSYF